MTTSIAIFCGSALGTDRIFLDSAQKMGQTLAQQGKTLVYGGGRSGLMGVLADSALQAGGRVIGGDSACLDGPRIGTSAFNRIACGE